MGKGRKKSVRKMRQRKGQAKKKARIRRVAESKRKSRAR